MLIPSDPRAGEWRHEVLGRAFWIVATSVVVFGAELADLPIYVGIVLEFSIWIAAVEGLLRRSVKLGILAFLLGAVVLNIIEVIAQTYGPHSEERERAFFSALCGAYAVIAAIGARNLLAAIFALIAAQLGGVAISFVLRWISNLNFVNIYVGIALHLLTYSLIFPATVGHAIWLGMKLSKRYARQKGTSPSES